MRERGRDRETSSGAPHTCTRILITRRDPNLHKITYRRGTYKPVIKLTGTFALRYLRW